MNTQQANTRRPVMVLGATLLAITIAAVFLWLQLRGQRADNQQLAARLTVLESVQPAIPSPEPQQPAAAVSGAEGMPAPMAAASVSPQPDTGGARSLLAASREMMNTPAGRDFRRVMQRQSLAQRYPDVQKALNLTADQVEKLLDVLAARESDQTDRMRLQRGPGDRAAREEQARKLAEEDRVYRAELAAVLGESYPKWDGYQIAATQRQREGWERQAGDQLRAAITVGNNPMSDAQFQALNAALSAEQEQINKTINRPQQQLQRLAETNRRLVDVAAAHLNPEQLTAYRRHLEQQSEMVREMLSTIDEND